jgi:RNA polymerase sigma-70 factor (ECF subfamily)
MKTTNSLVTAAVNGSKDAFTELIVSSEATLYSVAVSILKNESDVSDAIQDAIIEAYEKISDLHDRRYFKTWLVRILINKCYSIRKAKLRMIPTEFDENSLGITDSCTDTALDVHNTLSELSNNDRLILTLYYIEDIKLRDIASMLNISETAAKTRLSRSREHFRIKYSRKDEICNETN